MRRRGLALAIVLCVAQARAIGRIGNNSVVVSDHTDRYSFVLPKDFPSVSNHGDPSTDSSAISIESGLFAFSPPRGVDLQVASFASQYPQLVGSDPRDIAEFFTNSAGIRYEPVATVEKNISLLGESATSLVAVSVCEGRRGFIAFAPKLEITRNALLHILKTAKFEAGCGEKR